ncbi:hypothetical protein BH24CHL4_BH24CHL4_18280 [soil metagenome]
MNTFYQLIDLDSGNVISDFTNEEFPAERV